MLLLISLNITEVKKILKCVILCNLYLTFDEILITRMQQQMSTKSSVMSRVHLAIPHQHHVHWPPPCPAAPPQLTPSHHQQHR